MRPTFAAGILLLVLGGLPLAASGHLGQIGGLSGALKKASDVHDLQVTDAEELELGATVSEKSSRMCAPPLMR